MPLYKQIGRREKIIIHWSFCGFETKINRLTTTSARYFFVTYDKIKKGRTIDNIQFHITKKGQPQELNGEYKIREQDSAYLQGKADKEVNQQALFAEAMQWFS
ncbi:MAG: hypothetical protein ACTIN8_05410 [Pseudolactococcus laudensis]